MRIYQLRLDEFFHCMHAFCFAADPLESPADPLESLGFFWFTWFVLVHFGGEGDSGCEVG